MDFRRELRRVAATPLSLLAAACLLMGIPPVRAGTFGPYSGPAEQLARFVPGGYWSGSVQSIRTPELLFFWFPDSSNTELWRSDGTQAGTFSLGAHVVEHYDETGFMLWGNGRLFFTAEDAQEGVEIWTSDGTGVGTKRLTKGLFENGRGWWAYPLVSEHLGLVFFTADDPDHGLEIWVSDGEVAGTHMVVDLTPGPDSSFVGDFIEAGEKVVFNRHLDPDVNDLWATDGTQHGTAQLRVGGRIDTMVASAQSVFFFEDWSRKDASLWKTDGSRLGTRKVANLPSGTQDPPYPISAERRIYFRLTTRSDGQEIWTSDGTEAGTRSLTHLVAPDALYRWVFSKTVGTRLVAPVYDPSLGGEIWVSDGTPRGTFSLDLCPGSCGASFGSLPGVRKEASGEAHFVADDGTHGYELWATDGTKEGTRRLTDICPGPCFGVSDYYELPVAGGWLLYATDGSHGFQIWWIGPGKAPTPTDIPFEMRPVYPVGRLNLAGTFEDSQTSYVLWAWNLPVQTCRQDERTLCLNGDRFRVRAKQQSQGAPLADAHGVKLTDDSGYFWFYEPENIELVVKLLDACGTPTHNFWAFSAGLTNVLVELDVEDMATGEARTYINKQGHAYELLADTGHFKGCTDESYVPSANRFEADSASWRRER